MHGTILVVDDDVDTAALLRDGLHKRGFAADAVHSAEACLEQLRARPLDVVITDVTMAAISGIELCERIAREYPDTLSIVITGATGLDTAIAAIRAGAFDYITKPIKADVVAIAAARAVEHVTLKRELARLRDVASRKRTRHAPPREPADLGDHRDGRARREQRRDRPHHRRVRNRQGARRARAARAVRPTRPSVRRVINCAAMAPLLESELFGHLRGAFTGQTTARPRLQAGGGTIFLDEIGEMPMEMQVKLLRVLQQRTVRPVGGDEEIAFRARVVTATNRDLELEVEEKRFREDLFYRINVVPIAVPPLRAPRRHPAARAVLSREDREASGQGRRGHLGARRPQAARVRLAGQRARARELYGARGRPVPLERNHDRRPAGRAHRRQRNVHGRLGGVADRAHHDRRDDAAIRPARAGDREGQQDARRARARHRSAIAVSPDRGSSPADAATTQPPDAPRRAAGCRRARQPAASS